MKNKKGFTLIEILAVIALIGVIMLLIIPNVVNLFKRAQKSAFYDEAVILYSNAYTSYLFNSSEGDYTKRFCKGKDTTTKLIDVDEKENFYYDITVNSFGEVISMKVSDDSYGINISGNPLKKKNIKIDSVTKNFDIYCNGAPEVPEDSLTCIITNDKRSCSIYTFNYARKGASA